MNIVHCQIWKTVCSGNLNIFLYRIFHVPELIFFFIFHSTNVSCAWEYLTIDDIDFDQIWLNIKEIILRDFAGDPVEGIPSPSVQNTIYLSQKDILAAVPQVILYINVQNPYELKF